MKLLHTADLHLDSPYRGVGTLPNHIAERLKGSGFRVLDQLVDIAMSERVDAVVVAGDVYDRDTRTLRAELQFRRMCSRLNAEGIPVFVAHGNHDFLQGITHGLEFPEQTYLFSGEVTEFVVTTKSGEKLSVQGFSYEERHRKVAPVQSFLRTGHADVYVGVLHGSATGPSDHERYASFSVEDLVACQLDYWALGHIHKAATLWEQPPIIYPGIPQGRHKQEAGEKGIIIAEWTATGVTVRAVRTDDITWTTKQWRVNETDRFEYVIDDLLSWKQEIRQKERGQLVSLRLVLPENFVFTEEERYVVLEHLQSEEHERDDFVWVYEVMYEADGANNSPLTDGDPLSNLLIDAMNSSVPDALFRPLFTVRGQASLSSFSREELEEITSHAKQLLTSYQMKRG
ncbi:metallophosphoesterase family protein [Bacillus fonticola]|uniref:metallophosphoesterase family protein n=1 Tax=Bacillus fonticola TaxID=2728853 RepID=UPI00147592BA|nr:DNA repair exonuclease [Bacillus fonticola]